MNYRVLMLVLLSAVVFFSACKKNTPSQVNNQNANVLNTDSLAGSYLVSGTYHSWNTHQQHDTSFSVNNDTLFIAKTDDSTIYLAGRGINLRYDSMASKSGTWCFDFNFYSTADTLRFIKNNRDSIWAGFYGGTSTSGEWYDLKGRRIR